ncbi:mitochondrial aspartate-glutamate transporter AGC1 [Lycium ferocissimum]|uniref:mitochondrial aspartate-glutamate transporter AGC1 n=1 Tax=Lycium ferocissimum TaxID=112874 RepID=UPI002814FC6B|nr:mitochondrial aspartate-glutamate transporter AGC1 [Lycium ferocissimum]XP_059276180.1 mitochondrial aspartate-glutamate transporter AGC1 [Lycium ferocissimum]XP_059276181.1 mitochondrial aspartate-glutamate transporter AGC1 [Lycium ferocissimum]XP_059276182.1 mitochondrial aspartate-glutamate transporter AGC1 [Lycium ferocissimum]XP_059276183.1 mitochondrial aspartate-glutamate transporter AGC1 [Lycium ferocissimum]XP_059276184.1 mitochondrial aspartate-glutamate transporter AGC1 [Lycium f
MARGSQPRPSNKPAIRYRCNLLEGALFELTDLDRESHAPISSENKENPKNSESSEIMSTSELITAVGSIWDSAARPLTRILSKSRSRCNNADHQENNKYGYSTADKISGACFSTYDFPIPVNVDSDTDSSPLVLANVERLTANQKVLFFGPLLGNSPLLSLLHGGSTMHPDTRKTKNLANDLQSVYGWMHEISSLKVKHHLNCASIGSYESRKCTIEDTTNSPSSCCSDVDTINADCQADMEKPAGSLLTEIAKHNGINKVSTSNSCLGHYNEVFHEKKSNTLEIPCSKSKSVAHEYSLPPTCFASVDDKIDAKDQMYDSTINEKVELKEELSSEVQISVVKDKPHYALAKQEHAFAGAMAGIFVSLCLHPVDTIKTVVQSCHNHQKPLYYIGKSFISERGVTALYRGISTNLASSAPISALYTFTYESVKGALLPLFPKEYHSFAHCLAGGCASIATSFIFTPSEHIKQQMQVGSHYKNCWNALIEIIRSGGLPSLYAGWRAVLWRNIPHSIIKFYTYERLKELRFSSVQLGKQNDTLMTLACGGLAGSTAALFTTPFDVVKTRLQTQIPGSGTQLGVFGILQEIGKREGLKGLYRGLSPRLIMYMTQGALFFASYESFKRVFSLEVPQPKTETGTYERMEDDPATLPSPS